MITLCIVFAHPDDESFGTSGTVALYAAKGVQSALICATRGEAGITNGLADGPEALARLRSAELKCAAQAMGLSEFVILDFADGQGAGWDQAALRAQLENQLRRLRPKVVITFDPGGITRHADHVILQNVTCQLVTERGPALGVRRLYYQVVTCPEQASPEGPSLACVPADSVDITVDARAFESAKRAALLCHRSQAADTAQLLDAPSDAYLLEQYQLAWSADGWRPAPGETDLLAGL